MKRLIMLVLVVPVVAAGCGGGPRTYEPTSYEPLPTVDYEDEGYTRSRDARDYDPGLRRDPAKTVDWLTISTKEGTRYLGGVVAVERILRNDAGGYYGVDIRLANRTDRPITCEVRLRFLSEDRGTIIGLEDYWREGLRTDWRKISFEPYGLRTIEGTARIPHAVGFLLHIRHTGSDSEGLPDGAAGSSGN